MSLALGGSLVAGGSAGVNIRRSVLSNCCERGGAAARPLTTMVLGSDKRGGIGGPVPASRPLPMSAHTGTLRVAVIYDDSGFVRVLVNRLERSGCQYRVLSGPVPAEE